MSSAEFSSSFPLSQMTTTSTSTATLDNSTSTAIQDTSSNSNNSATGSDRNHNHPVVSVDRSCSTTNTTAKIATTKSITNDAKSGHGTGPSIVLPENSRIVHPQYLEKYTNKKDLIRRLGNLAEVLHHDESIEADNMTEWPGLPGIAQCVVRNFVNHSDKDIRLFAVLVSMEIFTIYAPEVPWDRDELIDIFRQTIRQLGNLAHTTDPVKQPYFKHYKRILELFAHVKIGCVIVDLAQQEGNVSLQGEEKEQKERNSKDQINDDIVEYDSTTSTCSIQTSTNTQEKIQKLTLSTTVSQERPTPLEVVVELIQTILHCVRDEHPIEIFELAQEAIIACLDEYNPDQGTSIPVCILDELLLCIGQGPQIWVANAAAHQQLSLLGTIQQMKSDARKSKIYNKKNQKNKSVNSVHDPQQLKLPFFVQQSNPTYVVAASVIRYMLNKLATPVAQLLNGLLNGDSFVVEQSNILCPTSNVDSSIAQSPITVGRNDPIVGSDHPVDVYSIVFELHRVAPQILTTVIGTISNGLQSPDTTKRFSVTNLLGRLFSASPSNETTAHSSTDTGATMRDSGDTTSGRLLVQSNMASEFRACYREWLGRRVDVEASIRMTVLEHCVGILKLYGTTSSTSLDETVRREASDAVTKSIINDPNLDVRLQAIHQVTDWVYREQPKSQVQNTGISPDLLRAVGSRCSSKYKQERRDAVTALAKIYSKRYLHVQVTSVIDGGDDCPIRTIQEILHKTCYLTKNAATAKSPWINKRQKISSGLEEKIISAENHFNNEDSERYSWIPTKIFECLCYTDQTDHEMRNRVVQIIDEVLLGDLSSSLSSEAVNEVLEVNSTKSSKMTPTARAVGLAIVVDSLNCMKGNPERYHALLTSDKQHIINVSANAFKFMYQLFYQRSKLQQAISDYTKARAAIRECKTGTEEILVAEARARELLEAVSCLCSPSHVVASSETSMEEILTSFHKARDKHIFRILATVTDSNHTMKARSRALEELPKRTVSLGNAVAEWIHLLVKRCSMSDFMNSEIINHCVLLASECFKENDVPGTAVFLSCIKTAVEIFPHIGANEDTFVSLTELFSDCREESNNEVNLELETYGVVTCLSSVLSIASTVRPDTGGKLKIDNNSTEFKEHLMKLCTQDGSPEQARNAVYTLARLVSNDAGSFEAAALGALSRSTPSSTSEDKCCVFDELLIALTKPSKLKICDFGVGSSRLVSILCSLSALSDCAPLVIACSDRGIRAFRFALNIVLLGQHSSDTDKSIKDQVSSISSHAKLNDASKSSPTTPSSAPRKRRLQCSPSNLSRDPSLCSPEDVNNILENDALSINCRRICAAISFVVSHVRSTRLLQARNVASKEKLTISPLQCPTSSDIENIFQVLAQILRDKGLPPRALDRSRCKARHERAFLRQCASVHLLRLSDSRLGLEKKYISATIWHLLSESFLDEEYVVRSAVMSELSSFLIGSGIYGIEGSKQQPQAPPLRFLALVCLCSDGDFGNDHDIANGGAANVGKVAHATKNALLQSIISLRKLADASYIQCKARGVAAEKKFDLQLKMLLMPEYVVPYAFHLLALRRETPNAGGLPTGGITSDNKQSSQNDDESTGASDESQNRVLRKRLKLLLEPLVHSLGDGADNISFLLRMTEILGKHYMPLDTTANNILDHATPKRWTIDSPGTLPSDVNKIDIQKSRTLEARLSTICAAAREVLLSFVKKDVNLSSYPGTIQLPSTLFVRTDRGSVSLRTINRNSSNIAPSDSNKDSVQDNPMTPCMQLHETEGSVFGAAALKRVAKEVSHLQQKTRRAQSIHPLTSLARNQKLECKTIEPDLVSEGLKVADAFRDGYAQKSCVHFSPEVRLDASEFILSEKCSGDNGFGDLSPIPKAGSPQFLDAQHCTEQSSICPSRLTIPQSALKSAALHSTVSKNSDKDSLLDQTYSQIAHKIVIQRDLPEVYSCAEQSGQFPSITGVLHGSTASRSYDSNVNRITDLQNVILEQVTFSTDNGKQPMSKTNKRTSKVFVPKRINLNRAVRVPNSKLSGKSSDDLDFDVEVEKENRSRSKRFGKESSKTS